MKATLAAGLLVASVCWPAVAQYGAAAKPAAAADSSGLTNATAAASAASTNKPDIKELMKGNSFTNGVGMAMVKISPTLWAGRFDVTQEEYQKVAGSNPSQFPGDRNPVDSVSWNDAGDFCAKLTERERKEEMLPEGFVYSLPTQAQWELLSAGAELKDAATSMGTRRNGTAPVGSLGANSLGLYDTRGNVWQWCLDPQDKPYRVLRGGAWDTIAEPSSRLEFRWYSQSPDEKQNDFGFRVVLEPAGAQ